MKQKRIDKWTKKTRLGPTGLQTRREVADDVELSLAGSSTGEPSAGIFSLHLFLILFCLNLFLPFDSYLVLRFSIYVCLLRCFSTTMIVEDYQLKNWPTWHPGGVTSESARTAAISRTGKIGFVPSAEKTSKSTYPRISMRVIPNPLPPPTPFDDTPNLCFQAISHREEVNHHLTVMAS